MSDEAKHQFEQEEQAYWQQREELLKQYSGKWVAIVCGQVVAVGEQMNKTAAAAFRKTGSTLMYVNLVGKEDIVLRIRQIATGYYDSTYTPSMPMVTASVSDLRMTTTTDTTFVVDTGANLTLLRQAVADDVSLWNDVAGRLRVTGIGGIPEVRQLYNAFIHIAGQSVFVTADCRDDLDEDILGRDVLNEFMLTVCTK
jgi:predicted aspartyl protease